MDFSFLNALYRTTALPPPEPWFSGTPLSYTYFGSYLVAAFGKALGIAPGVMFNLGIPLAAALTATSVYAAGTFLAGARAGLFAVLLALAAGNLAAPFLAVHPRAGLWEIFWDSSRVIPAGINEYPLWTFLFADLHAHALVMPFTAGFTALLVLFLTRREAGAPAFSAGRAAGWSLLSGLFLGAVQVTNGWSIPTYLALLFFLLVLSWWTGRGGGVRAGPRRPPERTSSSRPAEPSSSRGSSTVRSGRASPGCRPNLGWEPGPYARPLEFLEIWGFFLVLVVPFLFLAFRRSLLARSSRRAARPGPADRVPPPRRAPRALARVPRRLTRRRAGPDVRDRPLRVRPARGAAQGDRLGRPPSRGSRRLLVRDLRRRRDGPRLGPDEHRLQVLPRGVDLPLARGGRRARPPSRAGAASRETPLARRGGGHRRARALHLGGRDRRRAFRQPRRGAAGDSGRHGLPAALFARGEGRLRLAEPDRPRNSRSSPRRGGPPIRTSPASR